MKNYGNLTLVIGFCVVAIAAFTIGLFLPHNDLQPANVGASQPVKSHVKPDISGLMAKDIKDREKAAEAIRKEHAELVKQLIELAAKKVEPLPSDDPRFVEYPWHDSKHLSILFLGDLRAVESIPVLLENLEYENPRTTIIDEPLDPGGLCPAAEALSKIGMPAVGPVIDKLGKYGEQEKGHIICCWIIKKILVPRLGKVRIEMAIEETKDETVKKNLTAALPYFKTQQEKATEERSRREKAGKQEPLSKTEK